jgi:uncharacterized protein YukE
MSTSSGARQSKNTITNINRPYTGKTTSVTSSWRGDIGEACKDLSRSLRNDVTKTMNKCDSVGNRLDRLDRAAARADAEEMRKAAVRR